MYTLGKRFNAFHCNTPTNVGPGSYEITELVSLSSYGRAPFQSQKPRDLSFSNPDAASYPAPNEYHPIVNARIKGGTSMQSRGPRFDSRLRESGPFNYPPYDEDKTSEASSPHSGRLVRASMRPKASASSAPPPSSPASDKGFQEYSEKVESRRRKCNPQQTGKCSPCVLHGSLNLGRYRGVDFGRMTGREAIHEGDHGDLPCTNGKEGKVRTDVKTPGAMLNPDGRTWCESPPRRMPCTFVPDAEPPTSRRYLDDLVEKILRENFPAPNAYHVTKESYAQIQSTKRKSTKKGRDMESESDWKEIFFETIREKLNVKRRNIKHTVVQPFISAIPRFTEPRERRPGPADYDILASCFLTETSDGPPDVAFTCRSARFPNVKSSPSPGPGDYSMLGMTDLLLRRIRPRFCWLKGDSGKKIAFGSSASRVTDIVPTWVKELPGPSDYDTRVRRCSWKARSCPRRPQPVPSAVVDVGPSPSVRPARQKGVRPLRVTFCPRRPMKWKRGMRRRWLPNPFKARKRLEEVTPGPALYHPEWSLDNAVLKKGYSVRMDSRTKRFPGIVEDIPGPGHYQVVTCEMLKRSFNVKLARLALRQPRARPKKSGPVRQCVVMPGGIVSCPITSRSQAPVQTPSVCQGWIRNRFSVTRAPDEKY